MSETKKRRLPFADINAYRIGGSNSSNTSKKAKLEGLALQRQVYHVVRRNDTNPGTLLPNGEKAGKYACRKMIEQHFMRSSKKQTKGSLPT